MNNYYIKIDLQLFHDHETQESVESVQAEGAQRVLNLREESVVGHFLMRPHVVPGVQLINVTRASETKQRFLQTFSSRPSKLRVFVTYFGSVILRISLQRRPINVADSSTDGYLGMGMWVDW